MWEYPLWEVPRFGGGMVIALIATTHVLVAHYSVGAGIVLAVSETLAVRRGDGILLQFLERYSKVLLLTGFVFGAVSGVGIWFSISIVTPRATSALIHNFVWFWAIEWVFFLVEILSGYAYYSTWNRVSPKKHIALAWIYAVSAWMSLFVISGILSFMLSPADWLVTKNVWDGFFNPTLWPTVALRTVSSLSLGALAGAVIANLPRNWDREQRTHIINSLAWYLSPLVAMLPFAFWYFEDIPEEARDLLAGGAAAMMLFFLFGIAASTLVGFYAYFGLIRARRYINMETALLLLAIGIIATVAMEFVREGIRKPYLIYDYLYSNGLAKSEVSLADQQGVLEGAPWMKLKLQENETSLGKAVYQVQCSGCHVEGGFNDLAPLVRGWNREMLEFNLNRLNKLKHYMPPVVGTEKERRALAYYILSMNQPEQPGKGKEG